MKLLFDKNIFDQGKYEGFPKEDIPEINEFSQNTYQFLSNHLLRNSTPKLVRFLKIFFISYGVLSFLLLTFVFITESKLKLGGFGILIIYSLPLVVAFVFSGGGLSKHEKMRDTIHRDIMNSFDHYLKTSQPNDGVA